jgi:site-specific DNA recombinase
MQRKKLVVAYCRVSTFEQKRHGHGIGIQVRDVTLFAERAGLFVDRLYKDEAASGVTEDRKGLQRLLRDCETGKISKLILPALDRLSRDVRLAENLFYRLEQAGVEVFIADMPTYNGKDRKDVLIRQIREAIAEDNRKDIIERLWKGRQARVRMGKPPGGNVAYGFRRVGKDLTTDPGEAAMVQAIYELAARGQSGSAIARVLNSRACTRRNGKTWTQRQVAAILNRRAFYRDGILRYGDVVGRNRCVAIARGRG